MDGQKVDNAVRVTAQIKQYMVYGVSLAYPFISLITFLGVIKLAFDIPPEIAAIVAFFGVLIVGIISFKTGLYSHDMNISWKNTPMAVEIHKRTEDIESKLDCMAKQMDEQKKLIESLKGKV
jgi:hypothetical protein